MSNTKSPSTSRYATEAQLCDAFTAQALSLGWEVYPEVSGWDLLLVATNNVRTVGISCGELVGVEAKLRPSLQLLAQAHSRAEDDIRGPHYCAVLLPPDAVISPPLIHLTSALRLLVFGGESPLKHSMSVPFGGLVEFPLQYRWHYEDYLKVPNFRTARGGLPSPMRVTAWKVDAIRMCLTWPPGEERTLWSIKHVHKLSTSLWVGRGWITRTSRAGRMGLFSLNEAAPDLPHLKWPELAEQIRADLARRGEKVHR